MGRTPPATGRQQDDRPRRGDKDGRRKDDKPKGRRHTKARGGSSVQGERVLETLKRRKRALHVGELSGRLGLDRQDRDGLLVALRKLAEQRRIVELPGLRFRAAEKKNSTQRRVPHERVREKDPRGKHVAGRLIAHPRGYAFITAEDGGPDIFIPVNKVGSALHGDRVEAVAVRSARGREGTVTDVLERHTKQLVGSLRYGGRHLRFEPDDERLRASFEVKLAPGLKRPAQDVAVLAEFERYAESADEVSQIRIISILGKHGATDVEVAKIKIREGILEEFDREALEEAEALPKRVTRASSAGREDLRKIDLVTIDPDDARDHDDAVWAEKLEDGGFRLLIAIADVSHYVPEGSELDRVGLERGCSIYLPDRAIPMLPEQLSSGLASLIPNEDRLCLALEIELGNQGGVHHHRYHEGLMRSHARLTYGGVAEALGLTRDTTPQPEARKRRKLLGVLQEVATTLKRRRTRRGSLDFDLPEARVSLNEAGEPVDAFRSKADPGVKQTYGIVEELMLLANEVVAADFARRRVPTLYRVHGPPDAAKLENFALLAKQLGHQLDPGELANPKQLATFIRKVSETPQAGALNYLLLRSMQQAVYQVRNIGHFGLAAKHYLHFTSPIRRYPDIVVHRLVRRFILGKQSSDETSVQALHQQAIQSSRLERRAMTVEREVLNLYRALLMRDRIGETFDATITGIAAHGFYSALEHPFVETLTPIETLHDDHYEPDELGLELRGAMGGNSYRLGDSVRVRVEEVNLPRREVVALVVGEDGSVKTAKDARRPPRPGGRQEMRRQRGNANKKSAQRSKTSASTRATPPPKPRKSRKRKKDKS